MGNHLRRYTVTATLNTESETETLYEANDTEATFSAMAFILNTAVNSTLWAKGQIVLADTEGNEIRRMEAKV
jgi:hypothetical protein